MKTAENQFLEAISAPIYHVRKENTYPNTEFLLLTY